MDLLALGEHLLSLSEEAMAAKATAATDDERALMGQAIEAVMARDRSQSWLMDPCGWIDAFVDFSGVTGGKDLAGYQRDALDELAVAGRLAVRSVHGAGKTALAALTVLWFAITRDQAGIDWKIPTTATVYRQLLHYLWPEIHQWSARLRWTDLGREPFTRMELQVTRLKLSHGQAWAMASHDAVAIEGAHATHLLYVFDEAKGIPVDIWDAAEGAFSGAGTDTGAKAWALAISTPGEPSGRFYEVTRKSRAFAHWATRHVTLQDAIDAGRVSAEWAQTMAAMWPPGSAVYANRVLGEFAASSADAVIPLSWVEAANERWHEREASGPVTDVGVDVARGGEDESVITAIHGDWVAMPVRPGQGDGPFTATAVLPLAVTHPIPTVTVDSDGIGVGVYDELAKQPALAGKLFAFHAAAKAEAGGKKWQDRSGQLSFANCLTGDARITPVGRLLRVYRSWHDGPLLRVQMTSGDDFTATPNHNVLTLRGWVPVHALDVGDQLCDASPGKGAGVAEPQIGHVPATIGEMYRAASDERLAERVSGRAVDFHGDRPVGQVEVVTVDGDLLPGDPSRREHGPDGDLVARLLRSGGLPSRRGGGRTPPGRWPQDQRPGPLARPSLGPGTMLVDRELGRHKGVGLSLAAQLHALAPQQPGGSALSEPKRSGQTFDRLAGQVATGQVGEVHCDGVGEGDGFGLAPWLDAVFAQGSADHGPVDPEALAQRVQRLAGCIPLDEVVAIEVVSPGRHGGSWVYTAETSTGAYRTASIVQRNCRAAAWWNLRDMLNPQWEPTVALPPDEMLTGDLTAPKWRLTTGGAILIESKEDIAKRIGRSTDAGDSVVMGLWGAIVRASIGPTIITNPARARIPVSASSAAGVVRSPFGARR